MNTNRDVSKHSRGKLPSGLLRGAAVSGIAVGLAAASLGGVPTAAATCIGISGINIGTGCFTTFGSFALGLGPGTTAISAGPLTAAIAVGLGNEQTELTTASSFGIFSFAWAGGPDTLAETRGNANLAIMQGENGRALAGSGGTQFENLNIAINFGNGIDIPLPGGGNNPTLDTQTNTVATIGQGNIAVNFFGDSIPGTPITDTAGWSVVRAGGLRLGLPPTGFANAAYNFFGDGNHVTVGDQASNFGLGFSVFGDRNNVVVNGPLAAGGALFQSDRNVVQTGPGIEINGEPNAPASITNVFAAGGTQRSVVRPSLNFAPGINSTSNLRSTSSGGSGFKSINQLTSSAKKFGDQLAASTKKIGDQLAASAKKFSDSVNAARGGAKADAAGSSDDDSEK